MEYIGSKINGYGPYDSSSSRSINLFVLKLYHFEINWYGPYDSSSSRSMNLFVLKLIPF